MWHVKPLANLSSLPDGLLVGRLTSALMDVFTVWPEQTPHGEERERRRFQKWGVRSENGGERSGEGMEGEKVFLVSGTTVKKSITQKPPGCLPPTKHSLHPSPLGVRRGFLPS